MSGPGPRKRKPAPRPDKAERGARQGAIMVEAVGLAPDRSGRPYNMSAERWCRSAALRDAIVQQIDRQNCVADHTSHFCHCHETVS